jgi:heme/copper-type cytochrome/quinol oxidase subunit 2
VSLPLRVTALIVGFLAVAAVGAFVVLHYFLASSAGPPYVDYTANVKPNTGASVSVILQEAPQTTIGTDPDWVSYFIMSPQTHRWVHTTNFEVPAGSRINFTIFGYDGCTPLRNPLWGKVTGTIGNVMSVDGKPVSVLNSYRVCSVAHTFAIPNLGVNIPVASPTSFKANSNLCPTSPCTVNDPHTVVRFSIRTPSTPGSFFWQCKIPCGLGFLDGNGGPMQTIGYMTGNMEVVG